MFPQPALHRNVHIMKESPLHYKICLRSGYGSVQILIFPLILPQTVHILARTNEFSGWPLCKLWPAWSVSKYVSVECHGIHTPNLQYCAVVRIPTVKWDWAETFTVMSSFIKTEHLFYHLLQLWHSEVSQRQKSVRKYLLGSVMPTQEKQWTK